MESRTGSGTLYFVVAHHHVCPHLRWRERQEARRNALSLSAVGERNVGAGLRGGIQLVQFVAEDKTFAPAAGHVYVAFKVVAAEGRDFGACVLGEGIREVRKAFACLVQRELQRRHIFVQSIVGADSSRVGRRKFRIAGEYPVAQVAQALESVIFGIQFHLRTQQVRCGDFYFLRYVDHVIKIHFKSPKRNPSALKTKVPGNGSRHKKYCEILLFSLVHESIKVPACRTKK